MSVQVVVKEPTTGRLQNKTATLYTLGGRAITLGQRAAEVKIAVATRPELRVEFLQAHTDTATYKQLRSLTLRGTKCLRRPDSNPQSQLTFAC